MYQRAPDDLTESTFRGKIMSMVAAISISTLFLLETKAYFSTTLETDLLLHNPTNVDEPQVQLNFDVTLPLHIHFHPLDVETWLYLLVDLIMLRYYLER